MSVDRMAASPAEDALGNRGQAARYNRGQFCRMKLLHMFLITMTAHSTLSPSYSATAVHLAARSCGEGIITFLTASPGLHILQTQVALGSRLTPYFTIQHPTKGKLPGPFVKLRSPSTPERGSKLLVLDVAALLIGLLRAGPEGSDRTVDSGDLVSEGLQRAVDEAVLMAGVGEREKEHWKAVSRQ